MGSFHLLDKTSNVFEQTVSEGGIEFGIGCVLTKVEDVVDIFKSSFSLLLSG